jgi:hypothetical protein
MQYNPDDWMKQWIRGKQNSSLNGIPSHKVVDTRIHFDEYHIPDTILLPDREQLRNWWLLDTIGDGTCFVHSILLIMSPTYRSLSIKNRTRAGQEYRQELADLFGERRDILLAPFIKKATPAQKTEYEKTFDRYVAEFLDLSIHIDDGVLPYLHRLYNVGFIYMTVPFIDQYGYHPFSIRQVPSDVTNIPYVMICHTGVNHYEALVRPSRDFFNNNYFVTREIAQGLSRYAEEIMNVDQMHAEQVMRNSQENPLQDDAQLAVELQKYTQMEKDAQLQKTAQMEKAAQLEKDSQLAAQMEKDDKLQKDAQLAAQLKKDDQLASAPNTKSSGNASFIDKPICESPRVSNMHPNSLSAVQAYELANRSGLRYEKSKENVCNALCQKSKSLTPDKKLISSWIHNKSIENCGTKRSKGKRSKGKRSKGKRSKGNYKK